MTDRVVRRARPPSLPSTPFTRRGTGWLRTGRKRTAWAISCYPYVYYSSTNISSDTNTRVESRNRGNIQKDKEGSMSSRVKGNITDFIISLRTYWYGYVLTRCPLHSWAQCRTRWCPLICETCRPHPTSYSKSSRRSSRERLHPHPIQSSLPHVPRESSLLYPVKCVKWQKSLSRWQIKENRSD